MPELLKNKVAIVTGASSGIGRATAELFVAEGARVVVADINDAPGEALARDLGPNAVYVHADVASADDIQALVDAAVAQFGGLHIMFNNAGIGSARFPHFLDDDLADFDRVVRINLFGVMAGTQRAARHMAKHGGGAILNNASIAGNIAGQALMTYRATKAAVIHLSKCLAIDLGQYGIRVNCLIPGHIRTPISNFAEGPLPEATARRLEEALKPLWDVNKPLKRQGVPEDAANAALFLCSDLAAQITGAQLTVDGGISAGDSVNHLEELLAKQAEILGQ